LCVLRGDDARVACAFAPLSQSKSKLREDIAEVSNVMKRNLAEVLDRGGKLESTCLAATTAVTPACSVAAVPVFCCCGAFVLVPLFCCCAVVLLLRCQCRPSRHRLRVANCGVQR
jgi:hypothetical protein